MNLKFYKSKIAEYQQKHGVCQDMIKDALRDLNINEKNIERKHKIQSKADRLAERRERKAKKTQQIPV